MGSEYNSLSNPNTIELWRIVWEIGEIDEREREFECVSHRKQKQRRPIWRHTWSISETKLYKISSLKKSKIKPVPFYKTDIYICVCTCVINKTSTRDSVGRVFRSRGLAGTSNAAFQHRPATALLLHNSFAASLPFMGKCMRYEKGVGE
jgi:hypothetical protein